MRTGTGTEVFTEQLVAGLISRGIRAEVTWLPLRAEYAPWTVRKHSPPHWASVVHVNTWLHPRFLPEHLPVVATLHHSMHDPAVRPYKGVVRAVYHRCWFVPIERRVLRRADRVVAVSRFVAETARRTLLDVPIDVIYNGVDVERFNPGNRAAASDKPFRLLYVGGWKSLKGVDLLAPIMRELGEDFVLHYTGEAAATRDCAGMPDNMHDLGRLSRDGVITAMQRADVLLFPSRSEGFGMVASEAMACGLPVVATRGSSLAEVIEDDVTGILCPPDDVVAFAASIRALAVDSARTMAMSHAARKVCGERFDIRLMIDAYLDLYRSIGSA
ncbi:glycosyltransferase family 4 protein [Rhodanobacter sp. PCA2]|uniref:glycosyltransferase family 4 protein n=1 Tax=Rhodanobacter sp. PCA2 TaxID=2006117 RepID=UPI001C6333C0